MAVFSALLPANVEAATLAQRTAALERVIWIFTAMTVLAGILVWFWVPDDDASNDDAANDDASNDEASALAWRNVTLVLKNPAVWLQGMIVVMAYTGYKGMDDLGLLARDMFAFDDVQAAKLGTVAFWVRPGAALAAGVIGDKVGGPRAIAVCFVIMIAGDASVALGWLQPTAPWMLFTMVVATSAAVFGLRGLYFALFDEANVPTALTGTAAGLVSGVGYTPDIFMGPLNGYLTDTYPGPSGHRYFFAVLAAFTSRKPSRATMAAKGTSRR